MRFFNGRKIELLAPAGNFEVFESIVESKCDAIYFGGQRMNMRMIRKGFNFSDEELKQAVDLAKKNDKETYITVNNLLDFDEIKDAEGYLKLLAEIQPSAIIVQDFAVLELIKRLNINLQVHASVMMNVHNLPMIQALKKRGVTRVVLSRETTLAEVEYYHANTDVELEYFTHGDMCVAHGAQCYYSSMLYGMSSNRGKCLKPCRWWFHIEGDQKFPLAVKDLSMISHLPEMIHAGVTSFKIEGRMREKDFITQLINQYGDVLDRYIDDPIGYSAIEEEKWIYENRKRDLSTAYAFGNPGIVNINSRYEGTGKFYSTGKMFSTPTSESTIDADQISALINKLSDNLEVKTNKEQENKNPLKLSVRVDDLEQAKCAVLQEVDRIYLAADVFLPKKAFTIDEIIELSKIKGTSELFVCTPQMMDAVQLERYTVWLPKIKPYIDGILVTNLGAIEAFKHLELPLVGDFSLNVFNRLAAEFYLREGLSGITTSIELPAGAILPIVQSKIPVEIIVHGQLTSMYMSHDLYAAYDYPKSKDLIMQNEGGSYTVKCDVYNRNHLLTQNHYCLLPVIEQLADLGVEFVRIEGQNETPKQIENLIKHYKSSISGNKNAFEDLKLQKPETRYSFSATRF